MLHAVEALPFSAEASARIASLIFSSLTFLLEDRDLDFDRAVGFAGRDLSFAGDFSLEVFKSGLSTSPPRRVILCLAASASLRRFIVLLKALWPADALSFSFLLLEAFSARSRLFSRFTRA